MIVRLRFHRGHLTVMGMHTTEESQQGEYKIYYEKLKKKSFTVNIRQIM